MKYDDLFTSMSVAGTLQDVCNKHVKIECEACLNEALPPNLQKMIAIFEANKGK